jgi:glucan 1,3-beta-glucosidase
VELLERLAARYRSRPGLHGIEVLNEPHWEVPTSLLKTYYTQAYRAIRRHCPPEQVAVVCHDGFRSYREFLGFLQPPEFHNVLFDVHRYQCFERADLDMDIQGHLHKAAVLWREEAQRIQRELGLLVIAGEWSLGLNLEVVSLWAPGPFNHALQNMDSFQQDVAYRAYGAAQLLAFEHYCGWFFWSYRTATTPDWCFRECVERGWLPGKFGTP